MHKITYCVRPDLDPIVKETRHLIPLFKFLLDKVSFQFLAIRILLSKCEISLLTIIQISLQFLATR